jgi:hypothetical protein
MFKFFWICHREPASNDPLAHPAIRAMSLDQIADLPMTPDWPHGGKRVSVPEPKRCRAGCR